MNFFCKLIAPRPTFAQDMTPAEQQLMRAHAVYWREWMQRGNVILFGLVADPAGAFGVGIVDFETADRARAFTDGDPTIQSGAGFSFEVHPMPLGAVVRG
jgi:hypothetical protein